MTGEHEGVTAQRFSRRKPPDRAPAAPGFDEPAAADFRRHFEDLYPRVLAYALRRLGDRSAAEDVAAETFLIAWRRRNEVPADALPWLFAVARNQVLNARRRTRRQERLAARVASEPVAGPVPGVVESDRIRGALARLDERDREVLMLVTWDGLDRTRAAAVLGCSENTFAVRLHRARRRLATALNTNSTTSEETRS